MTCFKDEAVRKPSRFFGAWMVSVFLLVGATAAHAVPEKEWTLLLFLNGHNNLDRFGAFNINQMEKVGSTDQVNMVVQWASTAARNVKRLYVQKDENASRVTSPVVEELGLVDMGDVETLNQFVRWGVDRYPAKKYFIAVWNHGSGWRLQQAMNKNGNDDDGALSANDISFDDFSGNHITTQQLGQAMREAARVIGHKVDLYGSDACLMAMAEVADEMADSVSAFVGSQELEPGDGWPYDTFSQRWVANPAVSANDLGKILTEEYLRYYQAKRQEVTFSTFDLTRWASFRAALDRVAAGLSRLDTTAKQAFLRAVAPAQRFDSADFVDLSDLLRLTKVASGVSLPVADIDALNAQLANTVIANAVTSDYEKAKGMSIWMPNTSRVYQNYRTKYRTLRMGQSAWGAALQALFQ